MAVFADLGREKYISLTTFKQDGTPVSTPVWVVGEDGRLLVWSGATTWKVKRLQRDAHVRVAPCSATGKVRGEAIDAEATILPEVEHVRSLIAVKYGLVYRLVHGFGVVNRRLRRKPEARSVAIAIVPAERG